ncbi:MAG: hypothetical protein ACQEQL_06790 [Pseudomonadota bacterium]
MRSPILYGSHEIWKAIIRRYMKNEYGPGAGQHLKGFGHGGAPGLLQFIQWYPGVKIVI